MRFEQLKEILEINRYGSLIQASQSLFKPYSTVRYSLHSLEKELGFAVFTSHNGQLTPTREGRSTLELSRLILNDLEAIKRLIHDDHTDIGQVTVGISPLLINTMAVALISFMQASYPGVQLTLIELDEWSALDYLINQTIDFMLLGMLSDQQVMFHSVFQALGIHFNEMPLTGACHVLLGKEHPLAPESMLHVADLPPDIVYYQQAYYCRQLNLPQANQGNLYTDREIFKKMIYQYQAHAVLPDFFAFNDPVSQLGLWKSIPLIEGQQEALSMMCYLLWPKTKVPSEAENQMMAFLTDQFLRQNRIAEGG